MSKLLINEPPLQVLPSLAMEIGLNEAIFLQQLHYWLRTSPHYYSEKPWIYNSYADWTKQFPFWSEKTIRRIVAVLRGRGLIETTDQYNRDSFDKTLWYTINYRELDGIDRPSAQKGRPSGQVDRMVGTDWPDGAVKLTGSYTETNYTETTHREGESREIDRTWQQVLTESMDALPAEYFYALSESSVVITKDGDNGLIYRIIPKDERKFEWLRIRARNWLEKTISSIEGKRIIVIIGNGESDG